MKRRKMLITIIIIFVVIIVVLCLNVWVQQKFIKTYTYTELEYRGYTTQDISEVKMYAMNNHPFQRFSIS